VKTAIVFSIALLLSLLCYHYLGYQTERPYNLAFWSCIGGSFLAYGMFLKIYSAFSLRSWILLAALLRLLFLFSQPALSDDFYRFYWDGLVVMEGINPYHYLPEAVPLDFAEKGYLLNNMNSPQYYSVYPPLLQYCFALSAFLASSLTGFYLVFRLIILGMEAFGLYFFYKLLRLKESKMIWWLVYALNPLIIIEFAGNLHPEAMAIGLLMPALYYFNRNRTFLTAVFLTLAINLKLLPLLFVLPLYFKYSLRQFFQLTVVVFVLSLLLCWPYLDLQGVENFSRSLQLYIQRFEFNASLYYLGRYLMELSWGYADIRIMGPFLSGLSVIFLFAWTYAFRKQSMALLWLGIFTIYFLFTPIVHPWYITTLLFLGVLQKQRWVIAWSIAVFISYSAYAQFPYAENYWLIAFEYLLVLGVFLYEHNFLDLRRKLYLSNRLLK
jgi:hypothetical protein